MILNEMLEWDFLTTEYRGIVVAGIIIWNKFRVNLKHSFLEHLSWNIFFDDRFLVKTIENQKKEKIHAWVHTRKHTFA
jgi:hypothetical protein